MKGILFTFYFLLFKLDIVFGKDKMWMHATKSKVGITIHKMHIYVTGEMVLYIKEKGKESCITKQSKITGTERKMLTLWKPVKI